MTRVHVVTNPASGSLISSKILPKVISLLSDSSLELDLVQHETKSEGDGQNVARKILGSEAPSSKTTSEAERENDEKNEDEAINVVVLGGDGTTHELLDGFFNPESHRFSCKADGSGDNLETFRRINLALVPIGTSNALYHSIYPPESQKKDGNENDTESTQPGNEVDEDSWRLKSLESMIKSIHLSNSTSTSTSTSSSSSIPDRVPLTLALTKHIQRSSAQESLDQEKEQVGSNPTSTGERCTISHLLTSHSLHASILKDSEELRFSIPTIERFKVAAEKNSIRWTNGSVKLFGHASETGGGISKYCRKANKFVQVEVSSSSRDGKIEEIDASRHIPLEGPFIYLICLCIDRLEPSFIPAPFSSNHGNSKDPSLGDDSLIRPSDLLDVLMIRPLRDPSVLKYSKKLNLESSDPDQLWNTEETLELRKKFALGRLGPITSGMYSGGKHVGLSYKIDAKQGQEHKVDAESAGEELHLEELNQEDQGGDEEGDGDGMEVVEYYRCKGYEWIPNPMDERALLTCIDGTVLESSKTSSSIMRESNSRDKVWIWK